VFQEEEENVMPELTLIPLSNYTVRPWDLVATRYFSGSSTIIRWRTEITWGRNDTFRVLIVREIFRDKYLRSPKQK
jgi:hypothetical protein